MSNSAVDSRLARHYDITKDGGEEKYIRQYMSMMMIDDVDLLIPKVNVTAIFLSMSDKANTRAKLILKESLEPSMKRVGGVCEFSSDVSNLVPDYMEQAFSATLFAYLAAESFSNAIIPDDYVYEIKDKKSTTLQNKEQVERYTSLKIKYTKIIPAVYSIESPAKQEFWKDFERLERLRNEITHYKSEGPIHGGEVALFLREFFIEFIENNAILSSRKLIAWVVGEMPDHPSIPWEFRSYPFKDNSLDIVYPADT